MKINTNLLQILHEKGISINLDTFYKSQQHSSLAKTCSVNALSSTMTSNFVQSSFRVRELGPQKKEIIEDRGSQIEEGEGLKLSFAATSQEWKKKEINCLDTKNPSKLLRGNSLFLKNEQSTITNSQATADSSRPSTSKGNVSQSFYKEKNYSFMQTLPMESIVVNIYKDQNQNRIREQLLQFEEGEEKQCIIQDFNESNHISSCESLEDQDQLCIPSYISRPQSEGIKSQNSDESVGRQIQDDDEEKSLFSSSQDDNNFLESNLEELVWKYRSEQDENEFNSQLEEVILQEFMTESLTADLIEKITKCSQEEFLQVKKVTLRHNCTCDSLQLLGEMLPELIELNITDSIVNSLRDIGTSIRNLQVLWISRVRLSDLSGINAFPFLKEIYASFNSISDLNDFYYNDSIEVLDLEGNQISQDSFDVLETMQKLKVLNLGLNPICNDQDYEDKVKQKLSKLEKINDGESCKESRNIQIIKKQQEIEIFEGEEQRNIDGEEDLYERLKKLNWNGEKFLSEEFIKEFDEEFKQELSEDDLLLFQIKKSLNNSSKQFTKDEQIKKRSMSSTELLLTQSNFRRPSTALTPSSQETSRQNNQDSNFQYSWQNNNKIDVVTDSVSDLIDGNDKAFCGNPLKALKNKKKNDLVVQKKTEAFGEESFDEISVPKCIVNLLEQFKHKTNIQEVYRLKEELKKFDCLVNGTKLTATKRRAARLASQKVKDQVVQPLINDLTPPNTLTNILNNKVPIVFTSTSTRFHRNNLVLNDLKMGTSKINDMRENYSTMFKDSKINLGCFKSPLKFREPFSLTNTPRGDNKIFNQNQQQCTEQIKNIVSNSEIYDLKQDKILQRRPLSRMKQFSIADQQSKQGIFQKQSIEQQRDFQQKMIQFKTNKLYQLKPASLQQLQEKALASSQHFYQGNSKIGEL